jgi:capsular polysaccharide export protein
MMNAGLEIAKDKRVLLLQGPIGPFFFRLARDLQKLGATVSKIDFNGGDWLFSPKGSIQFRGDISEWPKFLEQVLVEHQIELVLLFGDCRPIHRIAHRIAHSRGLIIGVFEEGYIRPDYITFELFGVNAHSQIPRNPQLYLDQPETDIVECARVGNSLWHAVVWGMLYYESSILLRSFYRKYQHHRPLKFSESWPWLRSIWRKQFYKLKEKNIQEKLTQHFSNQYFLIPLQVHNDAQLHVHSTFASVESFISDVFSSFVKHAPDNTHLVIKHHPLDRGYHDYASFITQLTRQHKLEERVWYIHDQHLPTLLEHARGVVLINSTVGLSALHHSTPTKTCGSAIYNMKGLTFQGSLDEFWMQAEHEKVDAELYKKFRHYLIKNTQINGNFYRRLNDQNSSTGFNWMNSKSHIVKPEIQDNTTGADSAIGIASNF